ncbi:MAG: nickel-dependent lactate racemase [Rhodospirillales bacterium]|nr:nickel-dependent lactate racemase [Rhodospirillales bacterium]
MQVDINYAKGALTLDLDDSYEVTVIGKRPMPVLADPKQAINDAIDNPTGSGPTLDDLSAPGKTACILICDITRPVPNGLFLPILIRRLLDRGVAADDITVLVATGLHRPNEGAELIELVGSQWVMDTVRVENHFARDDAAHTDLGKTPTRGTAVRIDSRFVTADIRIATGLVEPHFMAGYSGGRKVIAPGVAHAETITTFHNAEFMENPNAINCNLAGNPLHEEQLEIVKKVGGALALNTVIDEERRLSFVTFGEIIESHGQAVNFVKNYTEVTVPRLYKTVVTSAAGYPLDKTYYQTVKGMVGAMDILEPGGNLIIASACEEGIGSAEFAESQKRLVALGADGFLAEIQKKTRADIDEWQTEMQLKPMRIGTIHLYTDGLSAAEQALTGVEIVSSVEQAVAKSVAETGDRAIAVIPEGPYVIPSYLAQAKAG